LQLPELCVNVFVSCFSLSIGRSQFEFEKNTNIKQVEQMRTMEMNLMTMTKQAEKLRGDVANAERRAQGKYSLPFDVGLQIILIPVIVRF
jgi:hypothetical protein